MNKTYRLMGTDRNGYCRTAEFRSSNRPNTRKWLEEVKEQEAWKGVTFTQYVAVVSDNPYRPIKNH